MTINFKKNTIEMTKAEAKAASVYGSESYAKLQDARRDYPTYTVVIKATSSKRESLKGLTYDYMEKYIKNHDDENHTIMEEFKILRGKTDNVLASSVSYGEVKEWFLAKFPEIADFHKKREEILAAAKTSKAA